MTFWPILNLVANGVLTAGISGFYILLYRNDSVVRRWPMTGSWLLKISLVTTAVSSLGNCISMSNPESKTEVIMNVGLAGIFAWAVMFHVELLKHGPNRKPSKRSSRSRSRQNAGNP